MSEEKLIKEYKYLVDIIYRKHFLSSGASEPDLKQEGMMALLKASRTYNADKGAKFETYASTVIYNRMIDVVRKEKSEHKDQLIAIRDNDARENTTPEDLFWSKERGHEIEKILKKECTDIELAIYKSRYLGRSYSEIVFTFGVTKKKIDNIIQKVKRIITEQLT
jgi:RNA polymerase sigma factor (sigma-70 family)